MKFKQIYIPYSNLHKKRHAIFLKEILTQMLV